MQVAVAHGRRLSIPEIGSLVVLATLLALGVVLVLQQPALGWDEAIYASKSRSLVTAVPASGWGSYRPPGLTLIGLVAAPFGFSDVMLRLASLVLGVATLGVLGLLTRIVWSPATALVALLGAAATPIVMVQLPTFHNDLASAGMLLAVMALLWHQLEVREAPDARLLLAAPLAAGAFYLRFGTLPALVGIAFTAVLLWPGSLRRHWHWAAGTLAIVAVLATPHVVTAWQQTGDPFGIVFRAADAAGATTPLASLKAYLRSVPGPLAGRLGTGYLLAGSLLVVAAVAWGLRRRLELPLLRALTWLLLPAGLTAVALILVSHAEPRYMLFPLLLGILVGAEGLVQAGRSLADWLPRRVDRGRATWLAWGLLIVVSAVFVARDFRAASRVAPAEAAWIADTGQRIRDDANGPCIVVTTLAPRLGWYSSCLGVRLDPSGPAATVDSATPVYVVFTSQDDLRATKETIDVYRAAVPATPLP